MSDGYKIRDQISPHFITATVVDWVAIFTTKRHFITIRFKVIHNIKKDLFMI